MIQIKDLRKVYGDGFVAIDQFDLELSRGEVVSIIGPSGCGKSTVLNIVAGLDSPDEGSVELDGNRVTGPDPRVGYMFQQTTLLPWRTVKANVGLPLEIRKRKKELREPAISEWIARVGLKGFADSYIYTLSGGMQKRVELAQSLIADPDILLMDEPFGALDALTRYRMQEQVIQLCETMGKTMLFVTHDLEEAIAISDRVVMMTAGPGSYIKEIFDIQLSRPRDIRAVKTTDSASALQKRMWAALEEELDHSESSASDLPVPSCRGD